MTRKTILDVSLEIPMQPATSPNLAMNAGGTASPEITSVDGAGFGTYPGGKSGAGTYQTIINQQPPHSCYIEPFLGFGGVIRRKRPAARNIGIDLDPGVIAKWRDAGHRIAAFELLHGDSLQFLAAYPWTGSELVYCDPPYLMETRSSGRLYLHEMSDDQHRALLELLKLLPCMVQISGYPSELYGQMLAGWRMVEFEAMTRGARKATEVLWMNYPEPDRLHTTWYFGSGYRERELIKRMRVRWMRKFQAMSAIQRQVILEALLFVEDRDRLPALIAMIDRQSIEAAHYHSPIIAMPAATVDDDDAAASPFVPLQSHIADNGEASNLLELIPPKPPIGSRIATVGDVVPEINRSTS